MSSDDGAMFSPEETNTMADQPATIDPILRWPQLAEIVPISRSHAHALAAEGKFPKPIKLGPRASGWLLSEVNAWLAERVAESRPDSARINVGAGQ